MDRGIKNGINRVAVENSGYAIQEFVMVDASDVDGISYFADNIDVSIKTIYSYDVNKNLMKTECFTYGSVPSDRTKIKNIYCIYDDVRFGGIWTGALAPVAKVKGNWYYIEGNKTINGETYSSGDILGCLSYGDVDSLRWAKCKMSPDGTIVKK